MNLSGLIVKLCHYDTIGCKIILKLDVLSCKGLKLKGEKISKIFYG